LLTHIDKNPEFHKLSDALKSLNRERDANLGEQETLHVQLSRMVAKPPDGENAAWQSYLNNEPDRLAQREELLRKLRQLEARQRTLDEASAQGAMEVKNLRSRLSKQPCLNARPAILEEIRKIGNALDIIAASNKRLTEIREEIEAAGYLTSSMAPGLFTLIGDEPWRKYISDNYPESEVAGGKSGSRRNHGEG
jgi:vacuolar-type H+-ATPase subunit I/STV1